MSVLPFSNFDQSVFQPGKFALLLLLLLLRLVAADRLYDPYGLDDQVAEQRRQQQQQQHHQLPPPQPASESRAAQCAAYRTYYLILVRRLYRLLSGHLGPRQPPDAGQIPFSVGNGWLVNNANLQRLKQAAEIPEPVVEDLQDANELLLSLFDKLQPAGDASGGGSGCLRWWPQLFDADWLVLAIIFASGAVVLCWLLLRRVSLWQLLLLVFTASWVLNYVRLYRLALAQRQHAVTSLNCRPAGQPLGLLESVGLWFSSAVRIAPPKDDCLKQMEALAVDPFWDVNPLEAASDLLGGVVMNRLLQLVKALNLSYRHLIDGLPIWHSFIITAIVLGLSVFGLLLRSGYGLRLMFGLLHLGPDAAENRRRFEALEAENRRLHAIVQAAEPQQPAPVPSLQRSASIACTQPRQRRLDGHGDGPAASVAALQSSPAPRRLRASRSESNVMVAA